MEIGICMSASSAGDVAEARPDFIEETVPGILVPGEGDEAFEGKRELASRTPIPIRAANCFLPGDIRCVGPEADHAAALRWAETTFARAEAVGIETIVFGSGGSRSVPDGFARGDAMDQFVEVLRKLGPVAERHGVTVVIEPLNKGECNFINSLAEGAEAARGAAHDNIRLLADIYHMARDGEPAGELVRYGELLRHCHIAEVEKRTPPGVAGDDFRPYFRALKAAGYDGRLSVECGWSDLASESVPALRCLREQLADAGYPARGRC